MMSSRERGGSTGNDLCIYGSVAIQNIVTNLMQNSELGPWFSVSHSFTQHTVHLLGRSEED